MAAIETSLGTIPIRGEITDRPKVLAITGAYAQPDDMSRLEMLVAPNWDGLVANLPGNRSPHLRETSIRAWGKAFDEVVAHLARPTIVIGISVGGLVALAMRKAAHVIALDPPLVTGKLWPLLPRLQAVANRDAGEREWLAAVFGVTTATISSRDYTGLLANRPCPTDVICGDVPLMPKRQVEHFPSLVDEPERRLIAKRARLHIAPACGHNVHVIAPRALSVALVPAMSALAKLPAEAHLSHG